MTGNQLNELFGQQKPPDTRAIVNINALNYKLADLCLLMDRLLPSGMKKDATFEKLKELKASIDSAAIHN